MLPRPGRLTVRTPAFHAGNRSSILRRGITKPGDAAPSRREDTSATKGQPHPGCRLHPHLPNPCQPCKHHTPFGARPDGTRGAPRPHLQRRPVPRFHRGQGEPALGPDAVQRRLPLARRPDAVPLVRFAAGAARVEDGIRRRGLADEPGDAAQVGAHLRPDAVRVDLLSVEFLAAQPLVVTA